jgi:predicted NACHT family NTPase
VDLGVFDDAGEALLILGAPGSGKTTLLLELTRELLDRAERDDADPIPVVFNLSSWSVRRPPLKDWLVNELASAYVVPFRVGREWV